MSKPTTPSSPEASKDRDELDDVFDDIRSTCNDCEHPRCLGRIKMAKQTIKTNTAIQIESLKQSLVAEKKKLRKTNSMYVEGFTDCSDQFNTIIKKVFNGRM